MRKKWITIITVLMASMLLTLTTIPVLAQSEVDQSTDVTTRNALGIEAPRAAPAGEQVTITVFQRGTQEPVKDAGVWALTRDNAQDLKEELVSLREQGVKLVDVDLESIVSGYGIFLGMTNGAGKVMHSFEDTGGYLLVAVKANYIPGFARIFIGVSVANEVL